MTAPVTGDGVGVTAAVAPEQLIDFPEMAAAWRRVPVLPRITIFYKESSFRIKWQKKLSFNHGTLSFTGFLSATRSQTAGLSVPFKTPTRCFHNSLWAMRELQTNPQPGEQVYERVKNILLKKVRDPMTAVGIAWAIGFPCGIILFLLTKRQVEKNRLKQLRIRQKIKASSDGEYLRGRNRLATQRTEEVTEAKT